MKSDRGFLEPFFKVEYDWHTSPPDEAFLQHVPIVRRFLIHAKIGFQELQNVE